MVTNINPKELSQLLRADPSVRIIDIRTKGEVDDGAIAGAEWMDLSSPDFMSRAGALPRDTTYCLYCASGGRSMLASQYMESIGFSHIYDLAGGILAWIEDGKPTTHI
jgi:phage shock protein E